MIKKNTKIAIPTLPSRVTQSCSWPDASSFNICTINAHNANSKTAETEITGIGPAAFLTNSRIAILANQYLNPIYQARKLVTSLVPVIQICLMINAFFFVCHKSYTFPIMKVIEPQ